MIKKYYSITPLEKLQQAEIILAIGHWERLLVL
jgi:hypothetical protein